MKHFIWFCIILPWMLISCSTGVESTKKVALPKKEEQASLPTPEDLYLQEISPIPPSQWAVGKPFVALDDRAALIFDSRSLPSDPLSLQLEGSILRFKGMQTASNVSGEPVQNLLFTDATGREYIYTVRANAKVSNLELPMLADVEVLQLLDDKLRGKTLWTKSPLWTFSNDLPSAKGQKFYPVTVDSVGRGRQVFPANIYFSTDEGEQASLLVALSGMGLDSRSFASQFSLSDPKENYPKIEPDVWICIQQGRVKLGMTKAECRLSLGNPQEVMNTHNTAYIYDLWQYPDGNYLMFEDGILVKTKRESR